MAQYTCCRIRSWQHTADPPREKMMEVVDATISMVGHNARRAKLVGGEKLARQGEARERSNAAGRQRRPLRRG